MQLFMDFSHALRLLKGGARVARQGWNGRDMWVSLSGSTTEPRRIPAGAFWSDNNARHAAEQPDGAALVHPCFTMKLADGGILMGWTPNALDVLAEDWVLVP